MFLRILDYYSGVLFLTTNRVGTLDEAFKSRIHVSLQYPPLNRDQYLNIFRVNTDRVKEIEEQNVGEGRLRIDEKDILDWAGNHYDTNREFVGRWNGRQIRNAFLIAASLAHYDMSEGANRQMAVPNNKPGVLDGAQFEAVAQTTLSFDKYLAETRGKDDGALAADAKTRGHMKAPQSAFGHQYSQTSGVGFKSNGSMPMSHTHIPAPDFGYQQESYPPQHQAPQQWQGHGYSEGHDGATMVSNYSQQYGRPPVVSNYPSPAVSGEPSVPSWRKPPQDGPAPVTDEAPVPSWRKQQPPTQALPHHGHDTPLPGMVRQGSYPEHGGPLPTGHGAGYGGYDGSGY